MEHSLPVGCGSTHLGGEIIGILVFPLPAIPHFICGRQYMSSCAFVVHVYSRAVSSSWWTQSESAKEQSMRYCSGNELACCTIPGVLLPHEI